MAETSELPIICPFGHPSNVATVGIEDGSRHYFVQSSENEGSPLVNSEVLKRPSLIGAFCRFIAGY